jgi:hypothetical protein
MLKHDGQSIINLSSNRGVSYLACVNESNYPTWACVHQGVQIYVEPIPNNEVEQLSCSK